MPLSYPQVLMEARLESSDGKEDEGKEPGEQTP